MLLYSGKIESLSGSSISRYTLLEYPMSLFVAFRSNKDTVEIVADMRYDRSHLVKGKLVRGEGQRERNAELDKDTWGSRRYSHIGWRREKEGQRCSG